MIKAELWKLSRDKTFHLLLLIPIIACILLTVFNTDLLNSYRTLTTFYVFGSFLYIYIASRIIVKDYSSGIMFNIITNGIGNAEYIISKFIFLVVNSFLSYFIIFMLSVILYLFNKEGEFLRSLNIYWTTTPVNYLFFNFISKWLVTLLFISLTLFIAIIIRNNFAFFITFMVILLSPFLATYLDGEILKYTFFYMSDTINVIPINGFVGYWLYTLKNVIYILTFIILSVVIMKKRKIRM